jgi:hypothetical protein
MTSSLRFRDEALQVDVKPLHDLPLVLQPQLDADRTLGLENSTCVGKTASL